MSILIRRIPGITAGTTGARTRVWEKGPLSASVGGLTGRPPGHTGGVSNEQRDDADQLAAAAEEVEAGRGPVAVSRPGHKLVVLVSAEEWQRLEELESAEAAA
jgi:hypothetical protein